MNLSAKTLKNISWVLFILVGIWIIIRLYQRFVLQTPDSSTYFKDFGFALLMLAVLLSRWADNKKTREEQAQGLQ